MEPMDELHFGFIFLYTSISDTFRTSLTKPGSLLPYQYNNFGKTWKGLRLASLLSRSMNDSSFGSIFDADECSVGEFLISHFFTK